MTIFSANQLKFDKNYLNELTSDPNSGVFKQECKYHVALHPAQFNNFGESVKDELGRKIGRFDESFQGIMLGYENIKLQSQLGVIGSDNCHVHLDLEALFYVFHPRIDMVLKGIVTRTTKDHVGCLVYNTFNISLPKPDVEEDGTWLGQNVAMGSEVSFRITFVNLTARLPHIRGDLLSIESQGDISGISLIKSPKKGKKTKFVDEEVGEKQKKPHKDKRKKKSSISVTEDPTEVDVEAVQEKPRKNKRNKSLSTSVIDDSALYEDEVSIENGEVSPNKPKKQKKNKFRDYSSEAEVSTPIAKSEKKKRKKSMSFSIGENSFHTELIIKDDIKEEEVSLTPSKYKDSDKTKTKKNKKKKSKDDLDISLESLNISSLFTENMSFDENSSLNMGDSPEKKRKRRKSQMISQDDDLYLDQVKLEPDSDLEKIIGNKKEKKSKS